MLATKDNHFGGVSNQNICASGRSYVRHTNIQNWRFQTKMKYVVELNIFLQNNKIREF